MILIVTTKATNGPKSTPNPMTLSVSTVARRGTKPLIVGLRKGLRNYNKNANLIETEIQVQTLLKHMWKNQWYMLT
jgi:hypothetical protein